jgi:alcohol dehydrogenase
MSSVPFDHEPRTRIVFGPGTLARVGELARDLGATRVLLVTDPGLVAAGHAGHGQDAITAAGLDVAIFDRTRENPTTVDVDRCLEVAREADIDFIVTLGGGSSIDTGRGCNFLLTNGGRMHDYWGHGKASKPMLPMIAVPTTTGTGSEMQSYALIADDDTHRKMACGDAKAAAAVAILDPDLAVTQPRSVIACTGLDAVAHAVETAVTTKRNPISCMYSREAFRLAHASLPRILAAPDDVDAQGSMMLAAAFAGLAIENSMLGAAHSMANPLTADFGIIHGQAVGMMLPHVVSFNREEPAAAEHYQALASYSGLGSEVDALVERLSSLVVETGLPETLGACGVPSSAVESLASGAAEQWTAQFNPRPVTADDFRRLYEAAL